MKFYFLIHFWK